MARTSSATKRLIWVIGALLILVVILGVVGRVTGVFGSGAAGTEVETAVVEIRDITHVVTASGKVQPETEVAISPDVSGEIIELPVHEGDVVERGILLARIKPDFYLTQVEQAQAGVLQAKAAMAQRKADMLKAESELRRHRDLYEKNAISKSALELSETEYEVAVAGADGAHYAVQSAEARLREAQEQVRKTAIYSPMSGTVSKLDVELGERVVGTSQMAGTEMMRVARLDQMEVEVEVNENEIVHVALGDTASIEVDAYPERAFRGVVTEIANSARTTGAGTQEQVTEFPVKVRILDVHNVVSADGGEEVISQSEVPSPRGGFARLRPGMSATVDVFTETVHAVVAVPIQAVTVRDVGAFVAGAGGGEGNTGHADSFTLKSEDDSLVAGSEEEDLRRVVFVVEEGKAKIIEVETGISDDTFTEVRSGLTGGETVIIGPYRAVSRDLDPGNPVKVEDTRSSPSVVAAGS